MIKERSNVVKPTLSRRVFLKGTAAIAASAGMASVLGACSSGTSSSEASDASESPSQPQVTTSLGDVVGVFDEANGIYSFKGIPYAEAPVGNLRFAPCEPLTEGWSEPKQCVDYGPSPMQVPANAGAPDSLEMSEDCLSINVWTPTTTPESPLPVYVWIYGGNNVGGSSALYDLTEFAKQDIVCVSFNYRTSIFGYFCCEALNEEFGSSGNMAASDMIAALTWIQENIAAFGGNPKQVTIAGESAGSSNVSVLVQSPEAEGLFNQAIMESGQSFGRDYDSAIAEGKLFLEDLGLEDNAEGIAALREMDAAELVEKFTTVPYFTYAMTAAEDKILPKDGLNRVADGLVNPVNILFGYNSREGGLFFPEEAFSDYDTVFNYIAGTYGVEGTQEIFDAYPVDEEHSVYDRMIEQSVWLFTLYGFFFGDAFKDAGANVWCYDFDFGDAFHSYEINYFYHNDMDAINAMGEKERAMADQMYYAIGNFVKTGNPNEGTELTFEWPEYTIDTKDLVIFNEEIKGSEMPLLEQLQFMMNLAEGITLGKGSGF